ncbi:MAG: hypothetical protein R3B93_21085 [Bacteroidia bacterium]
MVEYLFDRDDFGVLRFPGKNYQSEVVEMPPIEYRRILDSEQILTLIERGNYGGALEIYIRLYRKANETPVFAITQFWQIPHRKIMDGSTKIW